MTPSASAGTPTRDIAKSAHSAVATTRGNELPASSVAPRNLIAFRYSELETATDGFNPSLLLGTGGFGSVYRAAELPGLPPAHGYAVKSLADDSQQGEEQLRAEVMILGAFHHEAVLPLVGFCLEPSTGCLVYPLMLGGSLEDRLLPFVGDAPQRLSQLGLPAVPPRLSWQQRLLIIRDATKALLFLHTPSASKPVLLHRDIKPANILLDSQLNAKLGDVGLAREMPSLGIGRATHLTTRNLVGTPGFIDPLYSDSGQFSELTDGYAMGISLLMCLTGRPAVGLLDATIDALEEPTLRTAAAATDGTAAWPEHVALALMRVVIGLSWHRVRMRRMGIVEALRDLEAVSKEEGVRPGIDVPHGRECVLCFVELRGARFDCGHCVCCPGCASSLLALHAQCPVCRATISHVIEQGVQLVTMPTYIRPLSPSM